MRPYTVALTGGIGSGKSTVAQGFAELGAGVIDTDAIAHELTTPQGPAIAPILAAFGPMILSAEGWLDRACLRRIVFADPEARRRLEAILHPMIERVMLERLQSLNADYVLLVIPLLFETGQERHADRVLVVDVPETIQVARVMARSGLSAEEVQRIIAVQLPRHERIARAHDLIDNSGAPQDLEPQIQRLHAQYLRLAGA
ncbi:dephospho-CoA kinase [Caldichromatium japonicum]|uniref:Dephospho-CoA kinase n=1 Tax=Caldichromatium japonicum TaxID=2699430 RepID=A0A6G7VGW7_9GAMM|nr:dephospho-CoA kinase [Caldichromatium japonicum]